MSEENNNNNPDINRQDPRQIQDLEHYIRTHGIELSATRSNDHVEVSERLDKESEYQRKIHNSIFVEDKERIASKRDILERCKGMKLSFRTSGGYTLKEIPLLSLVETCDTIYTMLSSEHWISTENLEISVDEFDVATVQIFLKVLSKVMVVDQIPDDKIIECCRLAHFLQCNSVLKDIVDIIEEAVDSKNCFSICVLADQLQIHSLFETAVSHMVGELDSVEHDDIWKDFPLALKHSILTMRNAMRSSILARGRKNKVFFSSSEEFLAIFADHIREQKERLKEAKLRNSEIIEDRIQHGGRHRDPMSGSVKDAKLKIEKQENRLKTLQFFFDEQKAIFRNDSSRDGIFKAPFAL